MSKVINKTNSKTKVPRNFVLLDSLNKAGNYTHVTFGLVSENENDERYKNNFIKMEYWNATLMFDDGENINVFELLCRCTLNFPKKRPIVQFSKTSLEYKRIKKLCDKDGNLMESALVLIKYSENMSLGDYLEEILRVVSEL